MLGVSLTVVGRNPETQAVVSVQEVVEVSDEARGMSFFGLGLKELVRVRLRIMWQWERSRVYMIQAICILYGGQEG